MHTVYVDLDGVLADFDKRVKELTGKEYARNDNGIWDVLKEDPTFFSALEPMADASILWNYLKCFYTDVQILTAIPRKDSIPDAEAQKRYWVSKNLGTNVKFNIGPYAVNKQEHCRPGDILIDDSEKNIIQWRERGGIGILHVNALDTIEQLRELVDSDVIDHTY